ncbi:MAG: FAD-binding protein [Kiloniellales bacterium]
MQRLTPTDERELSALFEDASGAGRPLELIGRGSKRNYGRPQQVEAEVSLEAFSGIGFYEPEELVLSAGAATPMVEIESQLDAHKQMLAFEPMNLAPLLSGSLEGPRPDSLGGVVACNLSGPRRPRSGAARDHVLGLAGVNGAGACFKTGGRVVKNVTGYDLCKLLSGSLGTLAALTEVTVKVLPRPEKIRTLLYFGLGLEQANALFVKALGSAYDVSAAAFLPETLAAGSAVDLISDARASVTALRLEGPEPSVMARQAGLTALLSSFGKPGEELHASRSLAFWREIRDCHPFVERNARSIWRLSLPPSRAAEVVAALSAKPEDCFLDWGGGLLWLARSGAETSTEDLDAVLGRVGGFGTLVAGETASRAALPAFLPQVSGRTALSRRIKEALDPKGILNPGRLYAGI